MRKRRAWTIVLVYLPLSILLLVYFTVLSLLLFADFSNHEELSYQGKRLDTWVVLSATPRTVHGVADREKAANVVRHFGTNALPCLLAWLDYEPAPWKFKVRLLVQKLPTWISQSWPLTSWLGTDKGAAPAEWAVAGFEALGPIAKPAIPELTRRINLPHSPARKTLAMHALSYIGPDVHPAMMTVLTNINPMELRWASPCIGRMGPDARPFIPLLVQNLQHANLSVAWSCTRALGELQLEPDLVVPALIKGLADPRQQVQIQAATSLKQFGELARPALPALSNSLNDSSQPIREAAAEAIHAISHETLTNAPTR